MKQIKKEGVRRGKNKKQDNTCRRKEERHESRKGKKETITGQ
jgi:hypothetical protein